MKPEERDYIRYRIQRAGQALAVARAALDDGNLPDAVNRLYYACFYAVLALLLTEGKSASKHRGVLALFDVHWVNTGRLSDTMGRFFHRIFEARLEGDYEDLAAFERGAVESWSRQAETFIAEIAKHIEKEVSAEEQQ